LHKIALKGLNIGEGRDISQSGEIYAIKYINRRLRSTISSPIIFDVGANRGEYTLLLLKYFDLFGTIYSFEPSPSAFRLLSINLGRKNVKLFNLGFSKKKGQMSLFSPAHASRLASVYNQHEKNLHPEMKVTEKIAVRTITDFCAEQGIDVIHFLKIDVEGHEFSVLEGAKNMLATASICYIQFEFGPYNIASRTYFNDFYCLLKENYRIFRILRHGLCHIEHYNPINEIFLPTNFLAELK
jgi:FkbM family methyltransferase